MAHDLRLRAVNESPERPERDWVVYWMNASRRPVRNLALQRAARRARELERPLVVVEALSASYTWASERFHAFVMDGMADHQAHFAERGVTYLPYVEPTPGAGHGLHEALAARAALYVTDDWPCFHLPHWVKALGARLDVRLEAVDGCGLLPLRAADRDFPTAYSFRRFLQAELRPHLDLMPVEDPLAEALPAAKALPAELLQAYPAYDPATRDALLASLPIDHTVGAVDMRGGWRAGAERLERFTEERLDQYTERNRVDVSYASGLSPYLHFGHVGAHQVFAAVAEKESWGPDDVTEGMRSGKRSGWWGMSEAAESFMDELVTWRELGHNFCHVRPGEEARYEALPDWARKTLEEHAGDPRPQRYTLEQFDASATHDELWNAAQNQLRQEGIIHNYLRMLWGKKILHWTRDAREALEVMVELNNRYALDGRDPNSYAGIMWVLGRYDRAWGPERPIFGKIRYMTSDNTRRKLKVKPYLERFAGPAQSELF